MAKIEAQVIREQQKATLIKVINEKRETLAQIYKEINETSVPPGRKLTKEELAKRRVEKISLGREAEVEGRNLEKLQTELGNLDVTPLEKARAYSFSDEAERTVYTRARGQEKLSGKSGLLDEYSRRLLTEPSVDHIVPIDTIVSMDKWEKLSPEAQRRILSRVDNLKLMEKNLNSSKGARRWADWTQGKQFYGEEVWNRMVQEERSLYASIQKDILDSLR
jgi:hypothetical protein